MKKTLSNRINSLIIIISILLATIFFVLILNLNGYSQKRELSQINYFLDTLLEQKKEVLANEIFSGQDEAIESTIEEFTANEGILLGEVYSINREKLSFSGEDFNQDKTIDPNELKREASFKLDSIDGRELAVYTSGIVLGEENFGYIRLYYDVAPLKEYSRHTTAIILLLLAIKTLVLILILNIRLNEIVVNPIKKLEQDMSSISDGKFEVGREESQILEIEHMRSAFNHMAQSLKQTQENLESLVNLRTKELTESKRMLSVVIDTIPTPVFYKDSSGKYLGCNSAFAELLGKSKEEIVGKTIFDLMEESYAVPVFEKERQILASPKSQSYEGVFNTIYGVKDVIVNKASIVSDSGEVEGLVAVMSDITYRKEMEREMKYDAKFQELIADISADFISVDGKNIDEKIRSMLKAVSEFFGSERTYICRKAESDIYIDTLDWCGDRAPHAHREKMDESECPCFREIAKDRSIIVINSLEELSEEAKLEREFLTKFQMKSFMGVPIAPGGNVEGLLGLAMMCSKRKWSSKEASLLKVIANVFTDALEKKDIEDKLKKSNKELKRLSETDRLTQLYNRLKTDEVLEYEIVKSSRNRIPFSVILFDIDNFKEINDTYGHSAGDNALLELSKIIRDGLRKTDTLGRWGGEEFIVICPDTGLDGAISAAEKIRMAVESHKFEKVDKVTCSFGVTEFEMPDTKNTIVARADAALYKAKRNGRNRVEFK